MFNSCFLERNDLHILFWQSDADSDITGDYISMDNYDAATFVVVKGGSEDVDDIAIELTQATSTSGGSAKALNTREIWTKSGAFTSTGTWTNNKLTTPDDCLGIGSSLSVTSINAAGSVTATRGVADVNTSALVFACDINAADLDVSGGFKYVTVRIEGDNVNNACLLSAFIILRGSRYPQTVAINPID